MRSWDNLTALATRLGASPGLVGKQDIALTVDALGIGGGSAIAVGDDAAAIPRGNGWTLLACEGMMSAFVRAMPWFAGWSGVMVNLSDIAAMGGRPSAVVNAFWAEGAAAAEPVLAGMRAASEAYAVPVVGGHSNLRATSAELAVAVLGEAHALLTSFDAMPGDVLIAAIDLRGTYHDPHPFFDAATKAPPERLRDDLTLLPKIAEARLSVAAKDISQGGVIGTAAMLAECSEVGVMIDLEAMPIPPGADLERWLVTFPSYGYLLAAKPENVETIARIFTRQDIAAAAIGKVDASRKLTINAGGNNALVRDLAAAPLIGCAPGTAIERQRHA